MVGVECLMILVKMQLKSIVSLKNQILNINNFNIYSVFYLEYHFMKKKTNNKNSAKTS